MNAARHQAKKPSDAEAPEDVGLSAETEQNVAAQEPAPKTAPNDLVADIEVERDSIRAICFGEPS